MPNRLALAGPILLFALSACEPRDTRPVETSESAAFETAAGLPVPSGSPQSGAWILLGGERRPLRNLCDGINAPRLIAVLAPGPDGRSDVAVINKADPSKPRVTPLRIGDADPGAGQVYYPLLGDDGAEAGYLRTFNPGALPDPASATLPTLTAIKLGSTLTQCRWIPGAQLLGYTAQRSVLVGRSDDGGLTYSGFDFRTARRATLIEHGAARTTAATVTVGAGRQDGTAPLVFSFGAKGAAYDVRLGAEAADLVVSRDGAPIETEPFIAWVFAG